MSEFRMPSLGADMTHGTLVEWYVRPGGAVRRGQIIGLVDTHKGAIEIEVFEDGVVREIFTKPGERVPVGGVMAVIDTTAESLPALPSAVEAPSRAPLPGVAAASLAELPGTRKPRLVRGTGPGGAVTLEDVRVTPTARPEQPRRVKETERVRATPLARRIAEQHGVDLRLLQGSGARGAIIKADVERALRSAEPRATTAGVTVKPAEAAVQAPPASPEPDRGTAMRQAIAAAVTRSKREIPHYYLAMHVDMNASLAWVAEKNQGRAAEDLIAPAALQLRAVALALRDYPEFNGFWIDGRFRSGGGIHVGVAVSLRGGGLVVPAIRDADGLDVESLMRALGDLVMRARVGRLRGSEVTDATITVTSLGDRGVETVFGVIYPPQVALVGFGRIVERPWAEHGMLAVRPVVTLTLAADHRASDGHRGSLFLSAIADRLAEPDR